MIGPTNFRGNRVKAASNGVEASHASTSDLDIPAPPGLSYLPYQLAGIEYASKRETQRLGAVRLEAVPAGFWARWDRERLRRTGGTLEQYKHPCLIADPQFQAAARGGREPGAGPVP